ncbi:hypothetical protein D3C71_2044390 [compost metagenome]
MGHARLSEAAYEPLSLSGHVQWPGLRLAGAFEPVHYAPDEGRAGGAQASGLPLFLPQSVAQYDALLPVG